MTTEHYEQLREALTAVWNPHAAKWRAIRLHYIKRLLPGRFRSDLLHASRFPVNVLYDAGLNDEHIDAAIRRIVEDLADGFCPV